MGFKTHDLFLEREGSQKRDLATKTLGMTRRTDQERVSEKRPTQLASVRTVELLQLLANSARSITDDCRGRACSLLLVPSQRMKSL